MFQVDRITKKIQISTTFGNNFIRFTDNRLLSAGQQQLSGH